MLVDLIKTCTMA